MNARILSAMTVAALALGPEWTAGQEAPQRPEWDQKKAVEIVKSILDIEARGELPWDDIAWLDDPAEAAAAAQKEGKPIFVYFYLKKNVGPAAAPC